MSRTATFLATALLACTCGLAVAVASPARAEDDGVVSVTAHDLRLDGVRIHYLEAGSGPPVLLLHGGRYTSQNWRQLGTLELLARKGYRSLALDLPGFGDSEASKIPPEQFLASLLPLLTDQPVVVVSPSMSGSFSFPLLTRRPSYVAGLVALAPVGIAENLEKLRGSSLPTLIVWGEKDEVVPLRQARGLHEALAHSRLVILPGAGHPSYLEQPEAFHRELLQFLESLAPATPEPGTAEEEKGG